MGQNVECKNIEWDKMSNGNKEEKEIQNGTKRRLGTMSMSMSMSLFVSVSMDTDTNRDMDMDVDIGADFSS
jgi:hypothetical protein